jgi:hypothetical protein
LSFLPSDDREWLEEAGYDYEEVAEPNKRGVIVRNYVLRDGTFQVPATDVLVHIPSGYPDTQLDMFYCSPQLLLVPGNRIPSCANVSETHFGKTWQRWSRHYRQGQWRRNIDNLGSHFNMIAEELRKTS